MIFFFFFKQKTAYEMRISDWSSDVCSSDLMRWRQVTATEASRHRLYGPYGIMFSLLIGMLLNVPVRTLEYLGAIPPMPDAAPLWLKTLSVLCLADVVV